MHTAVCAHVPTVDSDPNSANPQHRPVCMCRPSPLGFSTLCVARLFRSGPYFSTLLRESLGSQFARVPFGWKGTIFGLHQKARLLWRLLASFLPD